MAIPLGQLTVREAQDEELEELLSEITGLSLRKVRTTLDASRGNTQLRNALAESWPSTPERLAVLRTSWLRELDLSQELSACTGLSTQTVERRLQQARGFEPFKNLSGRQNDALKRACSMDAGARFESCAAFLRALGWNR